MRYIVNRKDYYISLYHCTLDGFSDYFNEVDKKYILQAYSNHKNYNNKSTYKKLERYWRALIALLSLSVKSSFRKETSIFYTIDLFSLWLALNIKKYWLKEKFTVIYHQFELFDPLTSPRVEIFFFNRVKKKINQLNLLITPEQHRLGYFQKITQLPPDTPTLIIPNSKVTPLNQLHKIDTSTNNKTIIAHVGAVGLNHYIKEYLEVIRRSPVSQFEFWFIGILQDPIKEALKELNQDNIKLLGQIPHSDLIKLYPQIDLGIILYRDVGLNFRYCAPNKLYEYWSFGIPVVAHSLPGLQPLFLNDFQGTLVDMSNVEHFREALLEQSKAGDGTKLIEYFKEKYDISIYLKLLDDLLDQIQANQRSSF